MTPGSRVSLSNVVFTKVNVTGMVHHIGDLVGTEVLMSSMGKEGQMWTLDEVRHHTSKEVKRHQQIVVLVSLQHGGGMEGTESKCDCYSRRRIADGLQKSF